MGKMSFLTFKILYINKKKQIIMGKLTKDKGELSISISNELLDYIKQNYKNRSQFIEYCIKEQLNKFEKYQKIIDE